ncbi:MAG: hypothetical protein WA945_08545 [Arcobacteraceae bacterium]
MILKKIILVFFLVINVNAAEEDILNEELKKDLNKYFNIAKEYSVQGKNILVEQTVLNGINALVDTNKIRINVFDIDDTTNKIYINMFLEGEDINLKIDIDRFKWGVTEDKKYIVFEDFDIKLNIPWMQYVVDDIAKRDRGYIKVPHNVALFSLLYSIKPNIKSTYEFFKKEPFMITEYPFDERYVKIENFEISKNKIAANIWLKGSKEDFKIDLESYTLITANNKQTIVLKDLQFKEFTKPWIKSIIDAQNNEVHLKYTDKLFNLFKGDD